jgi:hypothetical protein
MPASLIRRLSAAQVIEGARWWQTLSPAQRRALGRDSGRPPRAIVGRFVESARIDDGDENIDFYEYLVNHEIVLDDGRRFHICSAHPAARAALAQGRVPAAFQCPRADSACPMRALLDALPGCDLVILPEGC